MNEPHIGERWTHLNRGGIYEIVATNVSLQCSSDPHVERDFGDETFVVYRSEHTGATYVRLTKEFIGKFRPI